MGKTTLSIVPINSVVFPHQTIKLFIPPNSIYYKKNLIGSVLGVCFQKNPTKKFSLFSYLTDIGIVIKVTDETTETNSTTKKSYKMIRGAALERFKVKHFVTRLHPYSAEVELLPDEPSIEKEGISLKDSLVVNLKSLACSYVEYISQSNMLAKARFEFIRSENNLIKLHYTVASFLSISDEEKCKLLEIDSITERIKRITQLLEEELYKNTGQMYTEKSLANPAHKQPTMLPSLLEKDIATAAGSSSDELENLKNKVKELELPQQVKEIANREINRLSQMESKDPDYNVQKRYLEILTDLPWNKSSEEINDIEYAEKILNKDHAGLGNVKKRILEFMAVRMLKKNTKGAIICLQGPPGIGKTSLGKSIAEALGKKFARISLGGVRDEAEIRGHRRTYVGAMPGLLIDSLLKTKTNNPVVLLDEIDKVGSNSMSGDPAAALLEVLDPNQNSNFQDHYLGVPFDLSSVLFIATANNLDTIPAPLLDRMEVISLAGYTHYEKVEIAKNYLIPKQIKENGIDINCVEFPEASIGYIIKHYTGEAGVRNLERTVSSLCRKVAFKFLKSQQTNGRFAPIQVTQEFIEETLGPKIYDEDIKKRIDQPGIAIGLAWTQVGGKTLIVETSKAQGKGAIQITGQLGDVMKESVITALGYIKSHKEILALILSKAQAKDPSLKHLSADFSLADYDMHIHFPAAAVPKDGPSAGVTIVTALISLLTGVKVRDDVAMTGEISLKGNVLAVGGIKEKCLAAYSSGIKSVLLPEQNRRNIGEIPKEIRNNMQFHFVKHIPEILAHAFDIGLTDAEIYRMQKFGSKTIHTASKL